MPQAVAPDTLVLSQLLTTAGFAELDLSWAQHKVTRPPWISPSPPTLQGTYSRPCPPPLDMGMASTPHLLEPRQEGKGESRAVHCPQNTVLASGIHLRPLHNACLVMWICLQILLFFYSKGSGNLWSCFSFVRFWFCFLFPCGCYYFSSSFPLFKSLPAIHR